MIHWLVLALTATVAHGYIDPTTPPMSVELLRQRVLAPPGPVTTLDQIPGLLPEEYRLNFVLKHGLKITGERGHAFEERVSQSADPHLPRVILWDERNGFTLSYNGGGPGQTSPQRLDILSFDSAAKTFKLEEVNFPLRESKRLDVTTSNCLSCHGPQGRPIFSMYPDWPSFYGSDNDELLADTVVQRAELADYLDFIRQAGKTHPRYAPLYDEDSIRRRLGVNRYPTFPFRYELGLAQDDPSRAFAFRPGLRLGLLYNRLMAQHLFARIKKHPRFGKMGKYFLYNLLQCGSLPAERTRAEAAFRRASTELRASGRTPFAAKAPGLMDYRHMLRIFDLKVNDVDMRFSYNHRGYESNDASVNHMAIGYVGNYFNSYFDGSATIDELLAGQMYAYYAARHPGLQGKSKLRGLTSKYGRFTQCMRFDSAFFAQMDALSEWLPMPYPASLTADHHREVFQGQFRLEHAAVCETLGSGMMWWASRP